MKVKILQWKLRNLETVANILDPEEVKRRQKERVRRLDIVLLGLAAVIAFAFVFQFFLRYTYVRGAGAATVVRVDRLSGDTCTMPCEEGGLYATQYAPYVAHATPRPDKVCHEANVVRVGRQIYPPVMRTPTPYGMGGFKRSVYPHHFIAGRSIDDAAELSDGHVYAFPPDVFANDVLAWSTGQEVEVCATWSRLENRPFYSVGSSDQAGQATLAM